MTALALGGAEPEPPRLPALRGDLKLHRGPRDEAGAPTWVLHDPAANRFFRLDWRHAEMLRHWREGLAPRQLAGLANGARPVDVTEADVADLVEFLSANQLLTVAGIEARKSLETRARSQRHGIGHRVLHGYLFFRLPLLRPDRLLAAVGPRLAFLFRGWFWWIITVLGLLGGLMVLRRWDEFVGTFTSYTSPTGMLWYATALVGAKIVHEFGHALVAWRHGVRIPTMGVAFMVLFPMLYTELSGVWTLASRRARLRIAAAGITAELGLAAAALFAWSVLPEGPARSAAFLLATATWILTLTVNLNPLMRFDGYYLLADAANVPNLQDRSFALGRWFLRKVLLGLDAPLPEPLPVRRVAWMVLFAYATWIYRFLLYLGIALLVYHFVVKVVGILLMAVEVGWFILRPVAMELRAWWRQRNDMRPNLRLATTLIVACVVAPVLSTLPVSFDIEAPAVLRAGTRAEIFAPAAARVADVAAVRGDAVVEGQILLVLEAPELDFRIAQTERDIAALEDQIASLATDRELRERIDGLTRQLERARARRDGLLREKDSLVVRAPVHGKLVQFDRTIAPGRWLPSGGSLGLVADVDAGTLDAFVAEDVLVRLAVGGEARFLPDDPDRPELVAVVRAIDDAPVATLDVPLLASVHGGEIAVRSSESGALQPVRPLYRVRLEPVPPVGAAMELPGRILFDGAPESLANRLWRRIAATFIRESGF